MRLKVVLILGAIAALAILAMGCGGGGDSSSTTTTASKESAPSEPESKTTKSKSSRDPKRLTKEEFKILVNETCIQIPPTYKENRENLEKGGKTLTKAEINLKAAVPPLYIALEELETLNPPKGEEHVLKKVMSTLKLAAEGLEAAPNSELSGPQSPFAAFQKVASEYEFETCSGL